MRSSSFLGVFLAAVISDSGSARLGVRCCCASAGAVMTGRHLFMDYTDQSRHLLCGKRDGGFKKRKAHVHTERGGGGRETKGGSARGRSFESFPELGTAQSTRIPVSVSPERCCAPRISCTFTIPGVCAPATPRRAK